MESAEISPKSFVGNDGLMEKYSQNDVIKEMVDYIIRSDVGIAPFN